VNEANDVSNFIKNTFGKICVTSYKLECIFPALFNIILIFVAFMSSSEQNFSMNISTLKSEPCGGASAVGVMAVLTSSKGALIYNSMACENWSSHSHSSAREFIRAPTVHSVVRAVDVTGS
jgi:hypothetical protein